MKYLIFALCLTGCGLTAVQVDGLDKYLTYKHDLARVEQRITISRYDVNSPEWRYVKKEVMDGLLIIRNSLSEQDNEIHNAIESARKNFTYLEGEYVDTLLTFLSLKQRLTEIEGYLTASQKSDIRWQKAKTYLVFKVNDVYNAWKHQDHNVLVKSSDEFFKAWKQLKSVLYKMEEEAQKSVNEKK